MRLRRRSTLLGVGILGFSGFLTETSASLLALPRIRDRTLNRRWSKVWAKVERSFANWKERRSLAQCRQQGLLKNVLHFMLPAILHDMRR